MTCPPIDERGDAPTGHGNVTLQPVTGRDIERYLEDVARLRLTVFREWPYLYEGSAEEERGYLAAMARSPRALCVLASDPRTPKAGGEGRIVGASTAMPLTDEHPEFRRPFEEARGRTGIDPRAVFYLAESVLLPPYRGFGIGQAFFDQREAYAARLHEQRLAAGEHGFTHLAFCAVDRPETHPLKPPDYRGLDRFWRSRGYERQPALVAHFPWRDLGANRETLKPLTYWVKPLSND